MSCFQNCASEIRTIVNRYQPVLSDKQRSTLIAMAIARAIAMRLPLPSSPVSGLPMYFATTFDIQVSELISEYNEHLIIDVRLARDLVYKFYKLRYDIVYTGDAFGKALSIIGCHMPELFPETVTSVLTLELSQGNPEELQEAWNNMVWSSNRAIDETEAKASVKPLDMAVL